MTTPKNVLKAHVKEIKQKLTYISLSHGQILEILVSLLTKEESWNHFSASNCELVIPEDLTAYFECIARGQRRLARIEGKETQPGDRAERSMIMMDFLSIVISGQCDGFLLLCELIDKADYPNKTTPLTVDSSGKMVPLSTKEHPQAAMFNLGDWFFRENPKHGNYPWDATEKLALKKGFSVNQAALIRMLQREAPNHNWPIELWFEVGVLDGNQDMFLEELKNDQTWEEHFKALYINDGHYELK